jgi:cobyrinic acid a,c-diamide synthase
LPESQGADPFAKRNTAHHAVIAVAHDEAFNFVYADNLDLLQAAGAEIVLFSPLHDATLPPGAQGIYLCGGFPEFYAAKLARNLTMLGDLRQANSQHVPIYAECGGLMVLTQAILDGDGVEHRMAGLLPGRSVMTPHLTIGYRSTRAMQDNWLWQAGEAMRGHEFHHSVWQDRPDDLPFAYELQPDAYHPTPQLEGASVGNLFASYVHLHFLAQPELAERFVAAASSSSD